MEEENKISLGSNGEGTTVTPAPDVDTMVCSLGNIFHNCEIHRCSTYGCLNCGQYRKKTANDIK